MESERNSRWDRGTNLDLLPQQMQRCVSHPCRLPGVGADNQVEQKETSLERTGWDSLDLFHGEMVELLEEECRRQDSRKRGRTQRRGNGWGTEKTLKRNDQKTNGRRSCWWTNTGGGKEIWWKRWSKWTNTRLTHVSNMFSALSFLSVALWRSKFNFYWWNYFHIKRVNERDNLLCCLTKSTMSTSDRGLPGSTAGSSMKGS